MTMNRYELRIENVTMEVEGYNEYEAMMSTGILENADMIECANTKEQIWLYKVKINNRLTIAYIKRIFKKPFAEC